MTATGQSFGESYRLEPTPSGEIKLLATRFEGQSRGATLALALKARRRAQQHALTFYLTPARAEKWQVLFTAGFTARRRHMNGFAAWSFERGEETHLNLADAIKRAAQTEVA